MLNGACSRMVARIIGRTVHEEASSKTKSFDLLAKIRARRLKCMGHILRMDPDNMVYKVIQHLHVT